MRATTATSPGLTLAALLLLQSTTTAQLLGCDAVNCPVDAYRTVQCSVGNATLKAIGIANLKTSLGTQPLTWTLGLQELDTNSTQPSFDRNYYLGTPPSFQLNDTGCALFFEGIAPKVAAPNDHLEDFTCSNSLPEACIKDLMAQAQFAYKSRNAKDPLFCTQLRDALANTAPATCSAAKSGWGAITARGLTTAALTGSSAPAPIEDPKCHPTTGDDYALRLVSSSRQTPQSRESEHLDPIVNAVTPVMTLFAKEGEAEVGLTCLKLVEGRKGQTVDEPQLQGAGAALISGPLVYFSMFAFTYLWFILL
ncbi:hypothetical protein C7974DRAFT_375667 [Boeremia exigua]|uniref:uncharacterized protein n=1 Tax=Boeremia exigua TaxID=749465 RepID=UPI001E8DB1ED|nr:uncharacterized protein C7974DRAFT_375667 [Boeremia exigua]KAH6633606.1 hypothetical protein C7974DRAFT_375667 [Boeremia exigua]